jgi:hypothetical protein
MTDVRISATGQNVSSLAIVSADQVTILGDGTAENPLRAATSSVSSDFTANYGNDVPLSLGKSIRFNSNGEVITAIADGAIVQAAVAGVVVEILTGTLVRCRFRGLVELTIGQWDLVTGQSGGLTISAVYYLTNHDNPGDGDLGIDPGDLVVQVGVALNATTMLVGLPAVPAETL